MNIYIDSRPQVNTREDDKDEDAGAFGSAGVLAPQSSSRARMLAQQREIQLKRRQASMQNPGKPIISLFCTLYSLLDIKY